ncbi:helix-turn-helix domain-containing protein [Larkinella soli]|uniref:helix-turn-helix domain-containing protein n=1 Tax=Larkinella soli TaxID=1770527 RepID=UPI000FFCB567|nr:helix-turn-helix domain-containing protein [Larkinella soli]
MKLQVLTPEPPLQPFIAAFWYFESDFGVPVTDNRVIAPNGKAKIIIPFRNALFTHLDGRETEYPEQSVFFIGLWDRPVTLSSRSRSTGTIGLELTPEGAYRFTDLSMFELTNRIIPFDELYGPAGRALQERIGNAVTMDERLQLIQSFLIARLDRRPPNSLVDHTVGLIRESMGLVPVQELERRTGYSRRYLDLLFRDHLGLSPKTLATIVRFQRMYRIWATDDRMTFSEESLYDLYYDQAHFIREFRRYTGYSPRQYTRIRNEFGKIFYRR